MQSPGESLIELLHAQEPEISRIIPVFITRFNAAYGDPSARHWDITKEEWQRYEFLGDRVLSLVIAQTLFGERDPVLDEGEMTVMLSQAVSNRALDELLRGCDTLHLLIPRTVSGQNSYGERITAGAFEALTGFLYCEFGLDDVVFFINAFFEKALQNYSPRKNAKGQLQEYFQKRKESLPVYTEVSRTGPDNSPRFTVRVALADTRWFEAEGTTLSDAGQAAAAKALDRILDEEKKKE